MNAAKNRLPLLWLATLTTFFVATQVFAPPTTDPSATKPIESRTPSNDKAGPDKTQPPTPNLTLPVPDEQTRNPDDWQPGAIAAVVPDRIPLRSSLPDSERLVAPPPDKVTRTRLYIEGENFPERVGVALQPDDGVQKVRVTRLDGSHLICDLEVASDAPTGKRDIVLFNPQKASVQSNTGKSVNFYTSLTPDEEKKLDGQILRNKWNKYKKFKNSQRALAASWLAALMQELNLLPPKVSPPEGKDAVSWWDQLLFGAQTAVVASAEDLAKVPIPIDTLNAILELAELLGQLHGDPGTQGGAHGLRQKLQGRGLSEDEINDIRDELTRVYEGLRQRAGK
jgi:hypothetical protein